VQVLKGHTQFLDHHTLQVGDRHYTAQKILIAVGGKPIKPDIAGIEYTLTSDELLNLEQLPRQIAIIGGGYIGVEFASLLRGFGCDVTLMNRESCILEGFDDDVRSAVRAGLLQRGIQSLCNTTADQITQTPEGFCLDLVGDCSQKLLADTVLCAVGRAPNLEGLGLETVGIQFDQQAIAVDEQSRTTQPHIYAVGDCTNRKQLTPVARAEGRAAVDAMFSERLGEKFNERFDEKFGEKIGEKFGEATIHRHDSLIPSAVLSRPEAAAIGLTETEASEQYGDAVACYRKEFVPLRNSLTQNQQKVLIKLVVNSKSDRILGIHIVGENAAEMIQAGAIALQKGMTRQELMQMIGIHPSTLEELFSV
jgi:glutathione reductase (NADPH)